MWRLLLAGLICAGLSFGSFGRALALEYDEPVVPSEFLISAPAEPSPESGSLTLLRREAGERLRPAAVVPSEPVAPRVPAYGSYGCEDGGGRALWNWNEC